MAKRFFSNTFRRALLPALPLCLSRSHSPSLSGIFRTKIDDDVGIFVENFKARLQIRVVFFMENVLKFVFVDILICKPIECECV